MATTTRATAARAVEGNSGAVSVAEVLATVVERVVVVVVDDVLVVVVIVLVVVVVVVVAEGEYAKVAT